MTQSMQAEIDAYHKRQSRITRLTANMSTDATKRLREVEHKFEVAAAKRYGDRLAEPCLKFLLEGLIENPNVIGYVFGGVNDLPKEAGGWEGMVEELVAKDQNAQRSIAASDANLKLDIYEREKALLPNHLRMTMARDGTLDAHLEARYRDHIDRI